MAVSNRCLLEYKNIENVIIAQLPAVLVKTIIDKATSTNHSGAPATVTMYVVPSGGSPAPSNLLKAKVFAAGESYIWPELVNHSLNVGDSIHAICTAAASVNLRISGRENTN